jgi:two-component sensor histidine kinase/sensor domain CHASE-containing protein
MTIRIKTLGIVGLTLLILVGVVYGISQTVLTASFRDLETQRLQVDVQRAADVLGDELTNVESHTLDWSIWDETWRFAGDGNEQFIADNIPSADTIARMNLDFMVVVRPTGEIVWGQAVDSGTGKFVPMPESLKSHLSADSLLVTHESLDSRTRGVLLLPEHPLLFCSAPILTSQKQGPAHGALIMGRFLDDSAVERIGRVAHTALTVARFDDANPAPDFRSARSALSAQSAPFVQPLSDERAAAYTLIRDVYGAPALVFRVDESRDIYKRGQASIHYFLLALFGVGLACIGVSSLLLERQVLSRLSRLAAEVIGIGRKRDPSERVSLSGHDELTGVASAINGMLAELQRSEAALVEARNNLEQRVRERTADLESEVEERKRAEETIRASLREKEALLKEVHHRVKNNLQVVSSLLYLQSAGVQSEEALHALADSQNRISSMALVHERLYRSRDLTSIDMADYVRTVAENLLDSYGGGAQNVRLNLRLDDIRLHIDAAIPCGLIVNELVSNALKHGFPDDRLGEVRVELAASGDGEAILAVEDDGVGLPEGFCLETSESLGLQLVKTLATQLDGRLEYRNSAGARFAISFPLKGIPSTSAL